MSLLPPAQLDSPLQTDKQLSGNDAEKKTKKPRQRNPNANAKEKLIPPMEMEENHSFDAEFISLIDEIFRNYSFSIII